MRDIGRRMGIIGRVGVKRIHRGMRATSFAVFVLSRGNLLDKIWWLDERSKKKNR